MKHFAGVAIAAAAIAVATGADAATIQAFYTGTVFRNTDTLGVFAAPGTDLSGAGFTLSVVYDTARGTLSTGPSASGLSGGSSLGLPSIFDSVVLTINGVSKTLAGSTLATVSAASVSFSIPPTTNFNQFAVDRVLNTTGGWTDTSLSMAVFAPLSSIPTDLTTPFSISGLAATGSFGSFLIQTVINPTLPPSPPEVGYGLILDSLTVSAVPPAPVPLPAGGAVLAGGLIALAGVARRRKVEARKTG